MFCFVLILQASIAPYVENFTVFEKFSFEYLDQLLPLLLGAPFNTLHRAQQLRKSKQYETPEYSFEWILNNDFLMKPYEK